MSTEHSVNTVAVLLSTHNGEKFLAEQLESLAAQTYAHIELIVRDDGSSDSTLQILQHYKARFPSTQIVVGTRLGYSKSFLHLLAMPSAAKYFAFCDQDDVWNVEKIATAVAQLSLVSGPACYTSAFEIVDSSLTFIQTSGAAEVLSLESALVESLLWGCTLVLNREARESVIMDLDRARPISHDWWVYLVICAVGQIVRDPLPRMKYRQHASNQVGFRTSGVAQLARQVRGVLKRGWPRWGDQARSFYAIHSVSLDPKLREVFRKINSAPTSLRARLQLTCSSHLKRRDPLSNILLRILILFGRC